MTWGEAFRHTTTLAGDPSTQLASALSGWGRPVSREQAVLMDLYDLQHLIAWSQGGSKGSKPKPYPRPWQVDNTRRVKPSVSQDEVIRALRFAGHTAPIPTAEGG